MYNVLLSFPRSGNSWVRYAVEFVSQRPTVNGKKHYHKHKFYKRDAIGHRDNFGANPSLPAILLKRHCAVLPHDSWTKDDRFIFIVRDYRECIIRNVAKNTEQKITNAVNMYISNLEAFDAFEGDKLLIYYEDLIRNPIVEFNKIFSFLDIDDNERYNDFINNIERHKLKGIELYHDHSFTKGLPGKLAYHAKNTTQRVVRMVDMKIRDRCSKPLYKKYLSKYRPLP